MGGSEFGTGGRRKHESGGKGHRQQAVARRLNQEAEDYENAAKFKRPVRLFCTSVLASIFYPSYIQNFISRPPHGPSEQFLMKHLQGFDASNQSHSARVETQTAINLVNAEYSDYLRQLFRTFHFIFSAGAESRQSLLRWLAALLDESKACGRTHISMSEHVYVAPLGFIHNVAILALNLLKPIEESDNRIKKIDPCFSVSNKNKFIDSDSTKMAADASQIRSWLDPRNHSRQEAWRQAFMQLREEEDADAAEIVTPDKLKEAGEQDQGPPSVATLVFFCSIRALEIGPLSMIDNNEIIQREFQRVNNEVKKLEAAIRQTGNRMGREAFELKQKLQMKQRLSLQLIQTPMFMNVPEIKHRVSSYLSLSTKVFNRLLDPHFKGLPLSRQMPMSWAGLPETAASNVFDLCSELLHHINSSDLDAPMLRECVKFCVYILGSPRYATNPYTRSKAVTVIHSLLNSNRVDSNTVMTYISDSLTLPHLAPSLMRMSVDIGHTGSHTQSYDKFKPRYEAQAIFLSIWDDPDHLTVIRNNSSCDLFFKWLDSIFSDATELMSDVVDNLKKIHEIQHLKQSPEWNNLSEEEKKTKNEALGSAQQQVRNQSQLGKSNMELLRRLANDLRKPLMHDKMVDRLAGILNTLLNDFGSKESRTKLQGSAEYNFDVDNYFYLIAEIIICMCQESTFTHHIVADVGSYTYSVYEDAIILLNPPIHRRWNILLRSLRKAEEERQDEQEMFDDVPEEFQDALMGDIMRDPVILPSNNVVDRPTIERYLLSETSDPFTRQPLKIEMVKPATELKVKIDNWVNEQRSLKRQHEM